MDVAGTAGWANVGFALHLIIQTNIHKCCPAALATVQICDHTSNNQIAKRNLGTGLISFNVTLSGQQHCRQTTQHWQELLIF